MCLMPFVSKLAVVAPSSRDFPDTKLQYFIFTFLHLFLCQILLLLVHCDAIAFLASASVGFLLLWVVLLNMTKNICLSQEILNKITRCFEKKFDLSPTFLDAKLVTQHPQITLARQNFYTHIYVCRMHYHVLWNKIFQSIFLGPNFCNGDKIFGKNLRIVIFKHNFE